MEIYEVLSLPTFEVDCDSRVRADKKTENRFQHPFFCKKKNWRQDIILVLIVCPVASYIQL